MPTAFYLNDLDVLSLGFKGVRCRGMGNGITQKLTTEKIPGRAGAFPMSRRAGDVAARIVVTELLIRPRTSLLALEAAVVQLYGVCGGGRVEIRDGRDPSKKVIGILETPQEDAIDPQYHPTDPASRVTLSFSCDDPYRYDVSPRLEAGIGTTPRQILLGNAPVAPVLEITGATNPTVTLKSAGGVTLGAMGFTVTQGANDVLTVDCDSGTITTVSAGGAPTDSYAAWTTKTSGLLVLDAHDGDPIDALSGVTLEISSGLMNVHYRRVYT